VLEAISPKVCTPRTQRRRSWSWPASGRRIIALVLASDLLLAFASFGGAAAIEPYTASALLSARPVQTPCGRVSRDHRASAWLRIVGRYMKDPAGRIVEPYGMSLVGGPQTRAWALGEASTDVQILAADEHWHANAARIQVSEDNLLGRPTPGHPYNVPFAMSVHRLICKILSLHEIPIVNDNTMFTGNSLNPTRRTLEFWDLMSEWYGNTFPVIFDLYNEPRLRRRPNSTAWMAPRRIWQLWQWGGRFNGVTYVGMQALVNEIRRHDRVRNVIWAEGPYETSRMELLPHHLLTGGNIAYSFHKGDPALTSRWVRQIGTLTNRGIPLVDGEWSQYAALHHPWECYPSAYQTVPAYLAYLRHRSIGLIAWSLQRGSLVSGTAGQYTVHDGNYSAFTTNALDLVTPSFLTPAYACDAPSFGQGAGELILEYFSRYSSKLAQAFFPRLG
jgi:hypothetical protein